MTGHRRSRCAALLILVLIAGPSATVQMVAWASMLITRLPTQGLSAAWDSTFSGRAPCNVCLAAASMRVREGLAPPNDKDHTVRATVKKVESAPVVQVVQVLCDPVPMMIRWPEGGQLTPLWEWPAPEPPPPRCA